MTPRRLLTEQELKQKIEAVRWRASSPEQLAKYEAALREKHGLQQEPEEIPAQQE